MTLSPRDKDRMLMGFYGALAVVASYLLRDQEFARGLYMGCFAMCVVVVGLSLLPGRKR
jgi:hypothetical protein